MLHFLAKRAQILFSITLHLWWGTCLASGIYPRPYGGLDYMVNLYGRGETAWLLIGGAVAALYGVLCVYWQPNHWKTAILWCLPQQILLTQMAGGQLMLVYQEWMHGLVPVRGMYSLGYVFPAAIFHTIVLVNLYQRRQLEQQLG